MKSKKAAEKTIASKIKHVERSVLRNTEWLRSFYALVDDDLPKEVITHFKNQGFLFSKVNGMTQISWGEESDMVLAASKKPFIQRLIEFDLKFLFG